MDISSIIFISFAIFATIMSALVVATGLINMSNTLTKLRPFSYAIFFISFSALIGSIANTLGYPAQGTIQCSIQGFLILYFFPATWVWTTILIYLLRALIIHKKITLKVGSMHLIAWGIPLIPSVLPVATTAVIYGQDDEISGTTTCNFYDANNSFWAFFFYVFLFMGISFVCFLLMTWWTIEIYLHIKRKNDTQSEYRHTREYSLFKSVILFPLSLLITWVPEFLVNIIYFNEKNVNETLFQVVQVISTQFGTLLAFIYFIRSKSSRQVWVKMVNRLCNYSSSFWKYNNSNDIYNNDETMRMSYTSGLLFHDSNRLNNSSDNDYKNSSNDVDSDDDEGTVVSYIFSSNLDVDVLSSETSSYSICSDNNNYNNNHKFSSQWGIIQ